MIASESANRGRPSRASILAAVDRELSELSEIGGLPRPAEADAIWDGIWYEETHNSTAIEGNTLILKEVELLLREGRAVGDKQLSEYLEVQAYAGAARWVYSQAVDPGDWSNGPLQLTELRHIHELTVGPVWEHFPPAGLLAGEGPGGFRQHDIAPFASGIQPPPFVEVPALVTDWLELVARDPDPNEHPLEHLATVHGTFERIHPFRDGNGRVGRLVLNLLLVRRGYPPAIIYKRDRTRYLNALGLADRGHDGALAELIGRAVKHSLDRFVLPQLAGPARLLPLSALVDDGISATALRQAAERGRLRAQSRSGRWYSTKRWVDEYRRSRKPGRPKKELTNAGRAGEEAAARITAARRSR